MKPFLRLLDVLVVILNSMIVALAGVTHQYGLLMLSGFFVLYCGNRLLYVEQEEKESDERRNKV